MLWLDEPALGLLASVSVTPTEETAATAHHQEVSSRLWRRALPRGALGGKLAMRSSAWSIGGGEAAVGGGHPGGPAPAATPSTCGVGLPTVAAAQGEIDRLLAAFQFSARTWSSPAPARGATAICAWASPTFRPPATGRPRSHPGGVEADMHLVSWTSSDHEIFVGALGVAGQCRETRSRGWRRACAR